MKAHAGVEDIKNKKCEECQLKQPSFSLPAEGRTRWCGGCAKGHVGAVNIRKQKAGVAAERKRKAEGARMAREGEVKARKDAAAAAKTEKQQRDVVATARKQEGVVSDDMGEVPLAEWELVEGEAWVGGGV